MHVANIVVSVSWAGRKRESVRAVSSSSPAPHRPHPRRDLSSKFQGDTGKLAKAGKEQASKQDSKTSHVHVHRSILV
jgi:hypothetical protein